MPVDPKTPAACYQIRCDLRHSHPATCPLALKSLATLLLFLSLVHADASWSQFAEILRRPELDTPPQVEILRTTPRFLKVRVTNPGTSPLHYRVNEHRANFQKWWPSSTVSSHGFYWKSKAEGQWIDGNFPGCGTGLIDKVIAPGDHIDLTVAIPPREAFRLYMLLSDKPAGKQSYTLLAEKSASVLKFS